MAEFLAVSGRTPFAWSTANCGFWLADWLVARGYPDPAADLRGRYRTERGFARLLARSGGLPGLVEACAVRAGLAATDAPIAGDVGVVEAVTAAQPREPVGAICLGRRWAIRSPAGLIVAPMTPLAAWRV